MHGTAPHPPRDQHEEFANTLTHAAGVVLSVAGGVALLSSRTHWTVAVACGLYALTLVATYAASALSHGVQRPDWKHLLSIWDQGVIFLLIIGTYTPFLVAYLPAAWTMHVLAGGQHLPLLRDSLVRRAAGPNRVGGPRLNHWRSWVAGGRGVCPSSSGRHMARDRRPPRRSRHPAGARAAVGDLRAQAEALTLAIAGHARRPTPSRRRTHEDFSC